MTSSLIEAACLQYITAYRTSSSNLSNLVTNTVGIGEHVDIVADVMSLTQEMDAAASCLTTLIDWAAGRGVMVGEDVLAMARTIIEEN